MPNPAVAIAGASLVKGIYDSYSQKKGAHDAAHAQTAADRMAIDEQNRQFDAYKQLLGPYLSGGTQALSGQEDILGLNGNPAQQSAITNIQNSPQFASLVKNGENAMLQNASATGGLRGGNVEAGLAQFRPDILSALISQQYDRLGGLTSLGQNSAINLGTAGMNMANNVSGIYQDIGQAKAGQAIGQAQGNAGYVNAFADSLSAYYGMKGLGSGQGMVPQTQFGGYNPNMGMGTPYNPNAGLNAYFANYPHSF